MYELDVYLARYFLNAERLAEACRLSVGELSQLIRDQLVPAPSYVVQSSTIRSYVFGEMPVAGAMDGDYFHPANVTWVTLAQDAVAEVGREQAHAELKNRFDKNLRLAFADLNATTWRLHDSFADDGSVIADGLRARCESIWEHFLHGTFGLCVANPVSEAAIARKEVLQEKLTALSENGAMARFADAEARDLLGLIDAYARSAMPFSPVEYPVSSRKRLVEDLRTRIEAQHAAPPAAAFGC